MSSSSIGSSPETNSGPARKGQPSLPRRLFLFSLLAYLLLGGGRIASSDGHTMFTLSRSLLAGRLSIPYGNGKVGRNGLLYAKADPGQALVALPLVAIGEATALVTPQGSLRTLWPRAVASTLNAFVGAACVVLFFFLVRSFGYRTRTALATALGLGFSTSLLPYTKSYLREPLLMLALLASLYEIARYAGRRERAGRTTSPDSLAAPARAGLWLGAGMVVKSSLGLNVPILLAYLVAVRRRGRFHPGPAALAFLSGPIAAAAVLGLYNLARFGSPFESGYDPTVDNFSNPLLVGLYGQLLSSGKSIFLYAPLGLVGLWGFSGLARRDRAAALTAGVILVTNLVLHAKFASWAGEGSWGPRYLVTFLPLGVLPAAELVESGRRWPRFAAALAFALGLLVQAGGTAIYFGSYMRELGEYPYKRTFSDPMFMVRSHFVPNYSPVVGHWRLLVRNTGLLLDRNRRPELEPSAEMDGRLPIDEASQDDLRHVVDFWFCYLIYAGYSPRLVAIPLALLLAATGWACMRLADAARRMPDARAIADTARPPS